MPSVLADLRAPLVKAPVMPRTLSPAIGATSPRFREFGDSAQTRTLLYDNVLNAARTLEPMTNQLHTLRLVDVDYDGPDAYSLADQKKAILSQQSMGRSLRGTWELVDNKSGKVLDSKKATVARVPHLTGRGTFIRSGNEYTLSHQMRLRSGVYTRVKENGELAAHVNVIPGKGRSHWVFLDPSTGVFRMQIGQAKIPLVSALRAMGASDKEIRNAWGNDLSSANMAKASPADVDKLYARLVRYGEATDARSRQEAVAQALANTALDPETTKRTLGKAFKNVSVESMLATTRKLLAIRHKDDAKRLEKLGLQPADPDDRDSLSFMRFHGPEDMFAERVSNSARILRPILWRVSARKSVQGITPGVLNKSMDAVLLGSGLGQPLESINPAHIFEQQGRVTRMGEGGIPSIDAVPESSRNVQPSHFGFIDPLVTPESLQSGVDLRMASISRKGRDGQIYTKVRDARTGSFVWRTPSVLADAALAFPRELRSGRPRVAALVNGKEKYIPRKQVDYEIPHMEGTLSFLANMVPMKSAVKGQRAAMAARMLTQALPLVNAEAPFVQSGIPDMEGTSYEEFYGNKMGASRSSSSGKVTKITEDTITIRQDSGEIETIDLYNNFPYNRKTYIHQTPAVELGQRVSKGQLIATSNYVDKNGTTAIGLNVRTMYIPFRGMNFEDAIVISEGLSKRLTSQHMYKSKVEVGEGDRTSKKTFIGMFPGAYSRDRLEVMDDDGIVRKGAEVQQGDPLVLVTRERERTANQVHRGRSSRFANSTEIWNHHSPGLVTDVAKTKSGYTVTVKAMSPMQVGDKLSGRYGDKGVVSEIVPDDEMPVDSQGMAAEMLLNPLGVITRTNPAQLVEAALGKIVQRGGREAYKIRDFEDIDDLTEFAIRELEEHGLDDLETIIDPVTDRKIPNVFVGNRFFMKLHHVAEAKGSGRSFGGYTAEGVPARGGATGSKSLGMLDLNALLSHGATEVIRDAKIVRGQRNPEYWSALMSGNKPPAPKIPLVHEKFVQQLRASGINPVRDGSRVHIMALTDQDVDVLAGTREIKNASTVDWKGKLNPIRGGLFDEKLTGGHNGRRWSYIKLTEPMPSPVMEEPIRRMLGLTGAQYLQVLAGKEELRGLSGPRAIHAALDAVDVDKGIEHARQDISSSRGSTRDMAVRRLGYLKAAKRLKIHPREWILTKVPVLPPIFRPVSVMSGSGIPVVADANYLYRDLFAADDNLKNLAKKTDDISEERLAVYGAFKAVTGLGEPINPEVRDRRVRGFLGHVFGRSPKHGVVQRKLLASTTDVVGRAAITPNPDLDMDHVALPEDKAWEVYRPFVIRHLVRRGMRHLQASQAVKDHDERARKALLKVMSERPVIINRAPVLHRFGMLAAWPKLTKSDTMQVSPLVVGGFGADFDGDAMQYHVPVSNEARDEAIKKLLPSRNLFSVSDFGVQFKPSQEYVGGLHFASTDRSRKAARTFATKKEAIHAYQRGEISAGQRVEILNA